MNITRLEVHNFRNLVDVNLDIGHKLNMFYGQNGSGKTSLLEAIHYLGLARSFRTRNLNRLIRHDCEKFSIFCQLSRPRIGSLPVGIERGRNTGTIRIGGKNVNSLAELARILPLQLMNADAHLLLSSGPLVRRQFLDWGLFHVEPSFLTYWQRTNRLLKQRNALLRTAGHYRELASWDKELETCSMWLNDHRSAYLEQLKPVLMHIFALLMPDAPVKFHYFAGWNVERSLSELFEQNFNKERQMGYSQQGPQRADFNIKMNATAASEIMSQGQLKLTAYALRLAQGKHLKQQGNENCLFLIDDLASELDREKRQLVSKLLIDLDAQIFVSCIEPESLPHLQAAEDLRMFHVEHGKITPI